MSRFFKVVLLTALIVGCAWVEVRPIRSDDVAGVRFYRPWPYLWITPSEKGGCVMDITYLPDTKQEYIIIPHTWVGTVTANPTLTQGWNLTALTTVADSKAAEMINSISGLTGNVGKLAKPGLMPQNEKYLGPGLYRFHFGNDGDDAGKVNGLVVVFRQVDDNGNPMGCAPPPKKVAGGKE